MDTKIRLALNRLDAEIAEAEDRLRELKLRRKGAEAFIEYMQDGDETPSVPSNDEDEQSRGPVASPKEMVMAVFKRNAGTVLDIGDVHREVLKDGGGFEREQIRNAIHYSTRKGWIAKAGKRGRWVLKDASAPVGAGAEENEESRSDSSREEGGTDHGSAPLRDQDDSAVSRPEHLDHAGFRASIEGGEETR